MKLLLLDGHSLLHRAFYALPLLTTADGRPINAVYGFWNMLWRLLEEERPEGLGVAFDLKGPTFRHEEYGAYKGTRRKTPPELNAQIPLLQDTLAAAGIAVISKPGFEADDCLGSIASLSDKAGHQTLIVSGDRDLLQLVSSRTQLLLTKRGISQTQRYGPEEVRSTFGVAPEQIPDLKGLAGDSSDNIPGVTGIGEKKARDILQVSGSLEEALEHPEKVADIRARKLLVAGEPSARLSKRLATISRDVPLILVWQDLAAPDWHAGEIRLALRRVFRELEFHSLLKRLDGLGGTQISATGGEEVRAHWTEGDGIRTQIRQVSELGELVGRQVALAFSLDGDDLKLAVAEPEGETCWLGRGQDVREITDFVSVATPKIGHDLKPLQRHFLAKGETFTGLVFDTAVAAYLLNPSQGKYSLEAVCGRYLPDHAPVDGELCRKAATIGSLRTALHRALQAADLNRLFEDVEMPLLEVLAEMETHGIRVDTQALAEISDELGRRIDELSQRVYSLAGSQFNINSTRQLGAILFETLSLPPVKKTKIGYSTDADVLEALRERHPIISAILDYRQLVKLKSTYADGLGALVNPETGTLHTTFNQMIAATGRLSSTEPNLQNIPMRLEEGRRIRKVFQPVVAGNVFLAADYSQVELRVLAHLSQDARLVAAFQQGEDIHTRTAAEVFGVAPSEVTASQRTRAKGINFGIVYGISDFGLSRDAGITRAEAAEYITRYFERYPEVRDYLDRTVAQARELGYVTTILGRRRYLPDLQHGNRAARSFAERAAMNTPIQGSAADIIKLAMVAIRRRLKSHGLSARMVLQVHDELIFETAPDRLQELVGIVVKEMKEAHPLSVPLEVDVKAGPNWYDMETMEG